MTIVGVFQVIAFSISGYILYSTVDEHSEMSQELKLLPIALLVFGIFSFLGIRAYNKHYVLEMGLLNPQTIRLVTGRYGFWYSEKNYPAIQVKTPKKCVDVLKDPNPSKVDYFFLELENNRFSFLCDINNKDSYMNIKKVIEHFDHNKQV